MVTPLGPTPADDAPDRAANSAANTAADRAVNEATGEAPPAMRFPGVPVTTEEAAGDGPEYQDPYEPLLFPVGHYGGTVYEESDASRHVHQVRVGGGTVELTDEEYVVWIGAHGDPQALNQDLRWTRERAEGAVANLADDPAATVDDLKSRGVLVELAGGMAPAERFARYHRLIPLTTGLGNTDTNLDTFTLGSFQLPMLQVPTELFRLWAWGHLEANIWRACQRAAAAAKPPYPVPEVQDTGRPEWHLLLLISGLHTLLTAHAAYLDQAFATTDLPNRTANP